MRANSTIWPDGSVTVVGPASELMELAAEAPEIIPALLQRLSYYGDRDVVVHRDVHARWSVGELVDLEKVTL